MNLRQYLLLNAFALLLVVYAPSPTNAVWGLSMGKTPKEKKVNMDNFWHTPRSWDEKYPPPRTDKGVERLMKEVKNDEYCRYLDTIAIRRYIPYPNPVPSQTGWGDKPNEVALCRLHMRAEIMQEQRKADQIRRIMNYIRGDDLETEIPHVYERDPYAEKEEEEEELHSSSPRRSPARSPTTIYYTTDYSSDSSHPSMPSLETDTDTESISHGPSYANTNYFDQGYSEGYNHGLYGQGYSPGSYDHSYSQGYQQGYPQGCNARNNQGNYRDTFYENNNGRNGYSYSTDNNNGGSYGFNTAPDTSYENNNPSSSYTTYGAGYSTVPDTFYENNNGRNGYSYSTDNNNGGSNGFNTAPAPPQSAAESVWNSLFE